MHPADRDDELVTRSGSECERLCEREVMRVRWHAAAYEACLSQHASSVVLVPQTNPVTHRVDRRARSIPPVFGATVLSECGDPYTHGHMAPRRNIMRYAARVSPNFRNFLLHALLD